MIFSFLIAFVFSYSSAQINFPNFKAVNGLQLLGSAISKDSALQLTDFLQSGEAGAVWYLTKQSMKNGFESSFEFQITPSSGSHGDGFAFVLQNDTAKQASAIGEGGENMGYAGLCNALAIEFDTFKNDVESDSDANHIGVMVHNTMFDPFITPNHNGALATVADANLPAIMADDASHKVNVVYNGKSLAVSMDDQQVLSVDVDLSMILGDKNEAWVGFTAGTGMAIEMHNILSWTFKQGSTQISDASKKNIIQPNKIWMVSNSQGQVYFSLSKMQSINLSLFTALGKRIAVLENGASSEGIHRVNFSAPGLASGTYYFHLTGENISKTATYVRVRN